jgi:bacterioferritin (cytochrome b1)
VNDRSHIRYAGLDRPREVGLSVGQTAERLRRLAYAERRLMILLATRIVSIPDRDIKALLARVQYEHAQHADGFRGRVLELRTNKSKLEGAPDPSLAVLFDEAEHVPGVYPFMVAVTHTLEPALVAAYQSYLAIANELADYASVRLLRQAIADAAEHARLLTSALGALAPDPEDQALAAFWTAKLEAYLAAAGGIDGTAARSEPRPRDSSNRPYAIAHTLTRDATLPRVWDYQAPPMQDLERHLDYMMGLRLSEINVAEGLAIVLYETPDMPWSFYLDISRHLWDEMRHSLFGEAGIEATYGDRAAIPIRDYEGVFAMEAPPLEQYAVLGLEVEGKNMKYPPGKRQEWEFARDMAKHPLMTTMQDFDWADEVVHVNIARRQLDGWFEGGLKTIGAFSTNGKEHRTEVKHRQVPTAIAHPSRRVTPPD